MSVDKATEHQPGKGTADISGLPVDRAQPQYPLPHHYAPYPVHVDDEIDLAELVRTLAKNWVWILLATVLSTAYATAKALRATPIYRAEVVTIPVSPVRETGKLAKISERFGGLAAMAGIDVGGDNDEVQAVLAMLRSRQFTLEFISDNELMPVLFAGRWDPIKEGWAVEDPDAIPTQWDAYRLFNGIRFVDQNATGLVTVAIEWPDRHLAAEWANELVDRVNRKQQQRAIDDAEELIAFLEAQLKETTVYEIQQAIYRLIEAQGKKIMLAKLWDEFALEVIDKAMPPDEGDVVRPKRRQMVMMGFAGGLIFGIVLVFLKTYVARQNAKARAASGDKR